MSLQTQPSDVESDLMTPLAAQQQTPLRHDAENIAALFPALMLEAERVAHTVAAGFHGRRRAGPGETFWQHRPYGFGDSVNMIDWRQSARAADRLYVRQNEWEAAASLWIWRDGSPSLDYASSKGASTKKWRADVIATALAILLSEAGERVGLIGGERLYQGRTAPARILEGLFDQSAASDAPPRENVSPGAKILMISDFFSDPNRIGAVANYYADLGAAGVLLQIVDPAEEDFPFRGRTEFEDLKSDDRLVFGDAGSVARDYRRKFQAHRAALEALSNSLGWSLLAHRTDKPPQTALLSLHETLAEQRGRGS